MQNGYVVCHESINLKENEMNYCTHDMDVTTIIHALKMWRSYLMGKRFELQTYHNRLKHLFR